MQSLWKKKEEEAEAELEIKEEEEQGKIDSYPFAT